MEPRDYVVAVCRRWLWVVAAAAAAACCALLLARSAAPDYTSSSTTYVGVSRVETSEALASSARVQAEVLPSLVQLARSPAVLQPVVDDLGLPGSASQLADRVAVGVGQGTALLTLSVAAPDGETARRTAEAIGEQLREQSDTLYVRPDGAPLLDLVVTTPPRAPSAPTPPHTERSVLLGLLGGAGAVTLLSGLWELARPRVRDVADVARLTSTPVLAALADDHRGPTARSRWSRRRTSAAGPSRHESLRWLDTAFTFASGSPRTIGLFGTRSADLVSELQAGRRDEVVSPADGPVSPPALLPLTQNRDLQHHRPSLDALVLVVDARRARVRELRAELVTVHGSGLPLAGIVLDRVPPAVPTLWQRVRAALRGDAVLGAVVARLRTRPGAQAQTALTSTRWAAVIALFVVGLDLRLVGGMDTALLTTAALLPVWAGSLARHRGGTALAWATAATLVVGALLAVRSAGDHGWSAHEAQTTTVQVLGALGTVGLLLWARGQLPVTAIGVAYGLGLLTSNLVYGSSTENFFKFELSYPLTIIVLSLAAAARRPPVTVAALLVMGALNVTNDARSAFGFCVVAAALITWQARPRWSARRTRPLVTFGLLAVVAVGGYSVMTEALVSGALGSAVQARTVTQIDQSGSLLLGGRPEWTATWALMRDAPLGHGLGVLATGHDVVVAKAGMAVARIPTAQGYIEHYMLGNGFELHSVIADLWTNAGPVGIGLGLLMAGLLVRALVESLAQRLAIGLVCFVVLRAVWGLAFGPLPANLDDVALALGLALTLRRPVAGPPAAAAPISESGSVVPV